MKLHTLLLAAFAAFAPIVVACGSDGTSDPTKPPGGPVPTAAPTTDPPPPTGTPKRTMNTARAMQTPTDNLLFDPLFASLGQELAFAVYAPVGHVEVPTTSPAGTAAPVLVTKGGAGDLSQLLLMGQGGHGPLEVRVWIAMTKGEPPPMYVIGLADPENNVFPLEAEEGTTQKHGDRTYALYRASLKDGLDGQLAVFFDVTAVGSMTIAAPEVREPGATTKTMSLRPSTKAVPATAAVQRALSTAAAHAPVPIVATPRPRALEREARVRPGVR